MGILGFLIRVVKEAVQEKSAKNNLEDKLGRKVSTNELYSLGSHLDAAEPNAVQQPMRSTPREASVPFGDAKPPMKTTTKLLLFGIPVLFLGLLILPAIISVLPQRTYNRLNPFTPKPPEGTFPAKLGTYSLDHSPDYIAPSSYNPIPHFESEYKSGTETIRYTLWVYNNEAEMNADFEKRKKYAGGASANGKVIDNSDTRYAVAAMSGWDNAVVYKDGNYIRQIKAYRQQPTLDFEGFLKNAPPVPASTFNVADLSKPATNSNSSNTNNRNSSNTNNTNSSSSTSGSIVTVGQLLEEYKTNPAAADTKYKGKTITISGTAEFADKDKKGNPMVGFMKPGSTKPTDGMVACSFDKSQEAAVLQIKKGDSVKLQGKVIMSLVGSVMLENCVKL